MQVFLIGGTDLEGNHLASVTAYDAVLEESANFTDLPQPRAHAAVATDGSTIYVRPFDASSTIRSHLSSTVLGVCPGRPCTWCLHDSACLR